jgi:putative flippase GtrA
MIHAFKSKQFLSFFVTGGIAALVNFCSRILLNYWMDFSSSIIIAYLIGMITAFILAKQFVFTNSQQALHHSMMYFSLVNLFAVAQTWGISMGLVYSVFPKLGIVCFKQEIAHAIGIIFPVFTSYLGHKHLSFK